MLLEQIAHWNDLSPKLRKELEDKVAGYGPKIRYRFDISHDNPDPEKKNGKVIWPFLYTLDPVTFRILDPYEKREGKSTSKQIGLIEKTDEKGLPSKYQRIRVKESQLGILTLDITIAEEKAMAMYLELHPKMKNGSFPDATKQLMIARIDDIGEAKDKTSQRAERSKALQFAVAMSDEEVKQFAAAMLWEESDPIDLLRDRTEELAETTPKMFNDLVESKNMEYQATLKRAFDNQVIAYDPAEYRVMWASNQQLIVALGEPVNKNHVELLAEWAMTNSKGEEVYKKIKAQLK